MEFSHHSSNPLEVATSDILNQRYKCELQKARNTANPSSDPLAIQHQNELHEQYKLHINEAVGQELHLQRLGPFDQTPKPGGSRRAMFYDLHSGSDDELDVIGNDDTSAEISKTLKVEQVEEEDVLVQSLSDIEEQGDIKAEEWTLPEGNFFDGEKFPEEDEEMRSAGDDSRPDSRLESLSSLTPLSSNHSSPLSSPQSSRPPSPDEYKTLSLRPSEERDEILDEMNDLYNSVPELVEEYELIDRLGTGTFSSVYKAVDLLYNEWYNQPWKGNNPPDSSAHYQSVGPNYKGRGGRGSRLKHAMDEDKDDINDDYATGRVYVALKRIYTTSGPERIRNELSVLEDCRGCRHTSQIITAFRNNDQVVIVLPYQRNIDFRDFYQSLHPEGIKCYFRCLFRALRDIHARGIIHRDVKPANFLYDPFTGIGTLCDFGLASRMEDEHRIQQYGRCLHDPATEKDPHGKNRKDDVDSNIVKQAQREARAKSQTPAEKVGYPEQDKRPTSKANRAGTRGFRSPEVLFKCGAQTGAVDVWSAGVILLFFLTGKFPIFQSNDDIEGLMELASIMGRKTTERVATLHGRTFTSNVPDLNTDGITWTQFVERLNPDIHTPKKYDMRYYPHNIKHRDGRGSSKHKKQHSSSAPDSPMATSSTIGDLTDPFLYTDGGAIGSGNTGPSDKDKAAKHAERYANPPTAERHSSTLKQAFNFLASVLHFESTKRFTPRKALYHPFLEEPGIDPDDNFVPHRIGEGVCGEHHHLSEDGVHCVTVQKRCPCDLPASHDGAVEQMSDGDCHLVEDIIELEAGQGIPIGPHPCEYHRTMFA